MEKSKGTELELAIGVVDQVFLPVEWQESIRELIKRPIEIPIKKPHDSIVAAMEANTLGFQAGLHWLIKKEWSSKYKVPVPKKLRDSTETLGLWLQQILHLCEKCHTASRLSGDKVPYSSPSDWFQQIMLEFYLNGIHPILYSLYPIEEWEQFNCNAAGARREIRILSAICSKVASCPEERTLEASQKFALSKLLVTAMDMAEQHDVFDNKHYKPFIKAWRNMLPDIEKQWALCRFDENQDLRRQKGRGSNTENLTSQWRMSKKTKS